MSYILVKNDTITQIDQKIIESMVPEIKNPTETLLADLAKADIYFCKRLGPPPVYDENTQKLTFDYRQVNNEYEKYWIITDLTNEQILTKKQQKRENAHVTRLDFCKNLKSLSVLDAEDALRGAKGEWPLAMLDFLDYLDSEQRFDAEVEWATAAYIHRLHPFVLSLGSYLSLTDEQLDTLFEVEY